MHNPPTGPDPLAEATAAFLQGLASPLLLRLTHGLSLHLLNTVRVEKLPLPRAVAEVLGPLPAGQAAAVARGVLLTQLKNFCLEALWQAGDLEAVMGVVHCPAADALRRRHEQRQPTLLVFSHLGARQALLPALRRIGVPACVVGRAPPVPAARLREFLAPLPGLECLPINKGNPENALMLKKAMDRLRAGGTAAIALDGQQADTSLTMRFLGRRVQVARGAAVLARLTGAAAVPVALPFTPTGWGIEFHVGEPLLRPDGPSESVAEFERQFYRPLLRWFERFLAERPDQMRPEWMARLVKAPRAPANTPAPPDHTGNSQPPGN